MTNKTYCIYRHIRLDENQVFYIGIGSIKRSKSKRSRSKFWWNIVNQTDYEIDILKKDLTWEDACELEIILVAHYGRRDKNLGPLVNLTDGGDGTVGYIVKEETKELYRKLFKGRPIHENTREALKIGNLNKIITEEEKLRLRTLFKGRQHSEKSKLQTSLKLKGRKQSDELRAKKRLTRPESKPIICTKTGKTWISISMCAEENGILKHTLSRKLSGTRKNNTTFKYLE